MPAINSANRSSARAREHVASHLRPSSLTHRLLLSDGDWHRQTMSVVTALAAVEELIAEREALRARVRRLELHA